MSNIEIFENIKSKNLIRANELIKEKIDNVVERALHEKKKELAAKWFSEAKTPSGWVGNSPETVAYFKKISAEKKMFAKGKREIDRLKKQGK